jgi:glycosyltransferase involved in cell wall biosynthesis
MIIAKMNKLSNKRVALVYDWVDKWGGAERVLLTLHEMFPEAPLYTAVYDPAKAPWAAVFPKIIVPRIKLKHEWFPWLMPLIFESFNFDEYGLVISVSSFAAKGIITKPHTTHINYCLTPTRFLWSHEQDYKNQLNPALRFITKPVFDYLKIWDKIVSRRPDKIISISKTVQERVKRYYGLDSQVVYPPVDIHQEIKHPRPFLEDFFLYIGRLVAYKQVELIVEVFNDLEWPLVMIGGGNLEEKLKTMALPNISFLGEVTDGEVKSYLQHTKGVVYFHEEDFGIVPVEAMAAGIPVIGFNRGGVTETVIHGKTGYLGENLKKSLLEFVEMKFDPRVLKEHAQQFDKDRFKKQFLLNL